VAFQTQSLTTNSEWGGHRDAIVGGLGEYTRPRTSIQEPMGLVKT
jgi:hypothetical protein